MMNALLNPCVSYFLNFLNIHTPATPVPRRIKLLGSGTSREERSA